ncbi:hypothetical protein ILYODFUR_013276 [Ilyodon furcidens]|uniref:Uncharacterized protein n=2 Tax=Goodeidae TaxID=28758 RepID=A0ABU7DUI4_9TELE|nr:hypothetical protein [Characodon lateralis]
MERALIPGSLSSSPGINPPIICTLREGGKETHKGLTNPLLPRDRGDIQKQGRKNAERGRGLKKKSSQSLVSPRLSDRALQLSEQSAALCPSAAHTASQQGERGMNECRGGDETRRVGVSRVILQVAVPYSHLRVSSGG